MWDFRAIKWGINGMEIIKKKEKLHFAGTGIASSH
jgi:hypothetical protein